MLFMRNILYFVILVAALAGCSKDFDLAEGQRFLHPLVPDQQACDQVRQAGPVFNCFQAIEFPVLIRALSTIS